MGCTVEVIYLSQSGYKDKGVLVGAGDGWLELSRPDGELFLIPTTAVRLLKVVERANLTAEQTLLRPAAAAEEPEAQDGRPISGN
jgi:hypothetical protein